MGNVESGANNLPPTNSESEQNLDLTTEEGLRKIIICPICLEIPFPPIRLCYNGHIICGGCKITNNICPSCHSGYGNTRNFVAETLVEKCTFRCQYAKYGCQMSYKGSDKQEHLKRYCEFRPVECDDCKGDWIFSEYHSHLMDHHKINGVNSSEGFVVYNMNFEKLRDIDIVDKFSWPQYYFKAFEKTFLLRVYATNWFICSWVGLLGPKEDCKKYQVQIGLHLPSDVAPTTSSSGKVSHYKDDPVRDVAFNGRGLVTLLKNIHDYAAVSTDVAEWMYHVKITELQTEGNSTDPNATST